MSPQFWLEFSDADNCGNFLSCCWKTQMSKVPYEFFAASDPGGPQEGLSETSSLISLNEYVIQSNTDFHFIVFLPPTLYLSVCSLSDRTTTSCPCRLCNLGPHLFQSLGWSPEWMEGLLLASRWVLTSLDVLQKSPDKVHKNHWEVLHNSFWAHTFLE